MAGPSIAVRVLGDLTGFGKSMSDTASQGEGVGKRLGSAFKGALGAINQTGVLGPFGAALDGIGTAIDNVVSHAKGMGPALMGAGTAIAGIGTGLAALGSKDQAATKQLQTAIEATGQSYDDYKDKVEGAVSAQEKYGNTADKTKDALRILTQATNDPAKAMQYLGEASDLAAAKHISLEDAATKLGKAYNGNTKVLKEFGVQVESSAKASKELESAQKAVVSANDAHAKAVQHLNDVQALYAGKTKLTTAEQINLRNAQQAVDSTGQKASDAQAKLADAQSLVASSGGKAGDAMALLGDKIKGQADAQASTFTGHLSEMKAHLEDAAAAFGQKYGPAITAAGIAMAGIGAIIQTVPAILGAASTAWEFLTAVEYSALLPYLAIAAAVVALGVLIYELVTHWQTVWNAMLDAAKAVWDWIKSNWPLLLDILLGPIGIAVTQIVAHWQTIWDGIKAVWNWIKTNWPLLLEIITGPIGIAVVQIVQHWQTIKDAAATVWHAIQDGWNGLIGFFAGIPARITGALGSIWSTIKSDAAGAWNGIQDGWNGVINFFQGIPKRITDALGDLTSLLYNAGKQVIQGLINGIKDAVQGAVDAVKGAVGSVVSGAKSLLGIGSPSKVFHEIGRNTMEGYRNGLASVDMTSAFAVPTVPGVGGYGAAAASAGAASSSSSAALAAVPAVHIEHATFSTQVDVDLLLQQAAWAMRTKVA